MRCIVKLAHITAVSGLLEDCTLLYRHGTAEVEIRERKTRYTSGLILEGYEIKIPPVELKDKAVYKNAACIYVTD